MELEALYKALDAPDRTTRVDALRQAAQRALADGDAVTSRALTLYRRALIVAGAPLLDMVLGLKHATMTSLTPLPEHLLDGVVIWGHEEGVAQVLAHQARVISVGQGGSVCQWDAQGGLCAEHRWPHPAIVSVGGDGLYLAIKNELWRWAAPAAPALVTRAPSSIQALVVVGDEVIMSCEDELWAWSMKTQQLRELGLIGGMLASRDGQLICLERGGALSWGGLDAAHRQHMHAPEDDPYTWEAFASLRMDGLVVVKQVEDEPGSLYGPQTSWLLLDPLTGQRRPCQEQQLKLLPSLEPDGLKVRSCSDGTLRLLAAEHEAKPKKVKAPRLAIDHGRMLIADDACLTTLFAEQAKRADEVRLAHRDLKALMVTPTGSITMSHYNHSHAHAPFILVRDARGEPVHKLPGGGGYMDWVDASPAGQLLLSRAKSQLHAHRPDGTLRWSAQNSWHYEQRCGWSSDGRELAILTHGGGVLRVGVEDDAYTVLSVNELGSACFACSPSGERALIFSEGKAIKLVSLRDGEVLMELPQRGLHGVSAVALGEDYGVIIDALGHMSILSLRDAKLSIHAGQGSLRQIALRQDRALVVGRAGRAEVWDLGRGALVHELKAFGEHAKVEVLGCAWLDDERVVTSDAAGLIQLWSATTGAPLQTLRGHEGAVYAVAALTDGRLISGGQDGLVRLWAEMATDHEAPQSFDPGCGAVLSFSVAASGDVLIAGVERSTLWTPLNEALRPLNVHMHDAVLAPDGRSILAKTMLTQVTVISAEDGSSITSSPWSWFGGWPEQLWLLPGDHGQERRAMIRWRDGLGVMTLPQGRLLWRHDQAPVHVALASSSAQAWIVMGEAPSVLYRLEHADGELERCASLPSTINHMVADEHGRLLCVSEDGVAWLFGADGERLGCWGHPLALTQAALRGARALVADERGWWGALKINA